MNDVPVLLTIAQLAVGLAGFTGIVSALLSGAQKNLPQPGMRLRQLLETSLGAALYAFVPMLVLPVAGSEHLAWRVSNAILGAAHAATLLVSINRARALGGAVVGRRGMYVQMMRLGGIITIVLNFAAAYDAVPRRWQSSIYILGLLYLLFIASHTFMRLLFAIEADAAEAKAAGQPAGRAPAPVAAPAVPAVAPAAPAEKTVTPRNGEDASRS